MWDETDLWRPGPSTGFNPGKSSCSSIQEVSGNEAVTITVRVLADAAFCRGSTYMPPCWGGHSVRPIAIKILQRKLHAQEVTEHTCSRNKLASPLRMSTSSMTNVWQRSIFNWSAMKSSCRRPGVPIIISGPSSSASFWDLLPFNPPALWLAKGSSLRPLYLIG